MAQSSYLRYFTIIENRPRFILPFSLKTPQNSEKDLSCRLQFVRAGDCGAFISAGQGRYPAMLDPGYSCLFQLPGILGARGCVMNLELTQIIIKLGWGASKPNLGCITSLMDAMCLLVCWPSKAGAYMSISVSYAGI